MSWATVPLGKIISLKYGKALPARDRDETGQYPVAGSNGAQGAHSHFLVDGPGIVVGRKGSAGKVVWYGQPFWPIDTTYFVEPKIKLDMRYVFYLLTHLQLDRLKTVTGVPGLNREDVYREEVPLPPPSEQQRIVEILDQTDALRRKRTEADEKAQRILPALFVKMFGDAERHWSEAPISKLVEQRKGAIRTGPFGSHLRHSEFVEQGIPVLGIDNVVTNRFRWAKPRALPPEKYRQFKRFRVFPEDVLITIMGTTGRVCVAPSDLPECMSTKHLCVLTFDRQKVEPVYVWAALLFDPFVRAQVKSSGHGAIMEGWNTTIVKNLNLRVPSPDLQREFVKRARAVLSHETNSEVSADNLKNVYEAVTHRAFSGDLTAKWRESRTDELLRETEEQARMIEEANMKGAGRTGHGRPRRTASC